MTVLSTLTLLVALHGAAQAPDSISGRWLFTGDLMGNRFTELCALEHEGAKLTGSCRNAAEDNAAAFDATGEVKGDSLTLSHGGDYQGQPLTMSYSGTVVSAAEIRGTIQVPEFGVSGEFTATRAPAGAAVVSGKLNEPADADARGGAPTAADSTRALPVEQRVEALLSRLALDEKVALLGGVNWFDIPGNARLGLPRLGTADSPFGVRAVGPSTVYPGGIGLAATWDTAMARAIGEQIGRDARARGKQYSLGPGVNIYRAPMNGRNFEYFGEDPWLASRMAVSFIRGVQAQGVSSTIKHFVGNNSEFARNTSDSRIDERALREIYLPAFEAAVKEADVGAIMPAYNLTNGEYMTANHRLLTEIAKDEWGFKGVMMSDWGAVHSALGAANAGTDLEMPGPDHFNPDSLKPLLASGAITEATIDDKVRRLLRNEVRFGWLDQPLQDSSIPLYNGAGRAVAVRSAGEGMVLLRNDRDLLPFDRHRIRTVAVIGPNAYPGVILGGGSATVPPFRPVGVLEAVGDLVGESGSVLYDAGIPSLARATGTTRLTTQPTGGRPGATLEIFSNQELTGEPTTTRADRAMTIGRPFDLGELFASPEGPNPLAMGGGGLQAPGARWTGYYTPQTSGVNDFFVQVTDGEGSGARLFVDGRKVIDTWDAPTAMVAQASLELDATPHEIVLEYHSQPGGFSGPFVRAGIRPRSAWVDPAALELARQADAVVLAVGFDPLSEAEGLDRSFGLPPGQDELIREVAAANPNTVVVVNSGGAYDTSGWLDRVPALIQAWYPGELGNRALAQILFGEIDPSGHLPATFERRWADNPTHDSYYPAPGTLEIPYKEGIFVGYRGYDRNGVTPLFPFGYGLSYTTFAYANLSVAPAPENTAKDPHFTVSFDVTNTGSSPGAAVAQVYVSDDRAAVPRPEKELKGFSRVMLQPGETQRVTVPLNLRSLAYYDVKGKQWRADSGTFTIRVGGSSADLPLSAPLRLAKTVARPVAER